MSGPSEAYQRAEYIHGAFYRPEESGILTPQEAYESGVRAYLGDTYKTEQLYAAGELDDQSVYQTMSRSVKTGDFYLSTVYKADYGQYQRERITPNSPPEKIEVLETTLFMQAIQKIQARRSPK